MLLFKKKIFSYLYIFFLFLVLILFEFSTNFALSKGYNIFDVQIEEDYNLNFNKIDTIDKAFVKAFKILIYRILEKKDRKKLDDVSLNQIKSLIDSFSITSEKFINNKYLSEFDVQFNKKKLLSFLHSKSIISSIPNEKNVLILPIIINTKQNQIIYLNDNVYYKRWNNKKENYLLLNYILPNEDIEDYMVIKNNLVNIESYNFEEITKKYNIDNHIILIMFQMNNELQVLSKLKFSKENIIINKIYKNYYKNDHEKVENIILELKEIYDDKWKSINKLNTAISFPIRLSIDSKNTELSKKLEETFKEIGLISDFKIDKFDNDKLIYKIVFNSSPDKFIESMLSYKFEIDTSKKLWKIK